VGGTDLAQRLEALAEDRQQDAEGRKDARAKQAGVRFARRFVLVVPAGMAAAGAMIGGGRAAYASPAGQVIVLAALALTAACWLWAGRYPSASRPRPGSSRPPLRLRPRVIGRKPPSPSPPSHWRTRNGRTGSRTAGRTGTAGHKTYGGPDNGVGTENA